MFTMSSSDVVVWESMVSCSSDFSKFFRLALVSLFGFRVVWGLIILTWVFFCFMLELFSITLYGCMRAECLQLIWAVNECSTGNGSVFLCVSWVAFMRAAIFSVFNQVIIFLNILEMTGMGRLLSSANGKSVKWIQAFRSIRCLWCC